MEKVRGIETLESKKDETAEKEIFSAKVQIRKDGERRYGKGTIKITSENIYINFKKFLGKPQTFAVPRSQVAEVEFKVRDLPIKVVGPGFPFGSEQTWVTMDIKLEGDGGFNIYVGELWRMSEDAKEKCLEKYRKIQTVLKEPL
jgi:hypothetical protein